MLGHWVIVAATITGALGVLYAAARRAVRRGLALLRNALAVWRLPECVELLTQAVGTLTAELAQVRALLKPAPEHHRFGEEWSPWRNDHR
jgi:hypothetical protein